MNIQQNNFIYYYTKIINELQKRSLIILLIFVVLIIANIYDLLRYIMIDGMLIYYLNKLFENNKSIYDDIFKNVSVPILSTMQTNFSKKMMTRNIQIYMVIIFVPLIVTLFIAYIEKIVLSENVILSNLLLFALTYFVIYKIIYRYELR